jgi:hypothetical protein
MITAQGLATTGCPPVCAMYRIPTASVQSASLKLSVSSGHLVRGEAGHQSYRCPADYGLVGVLEAFVLAYGAPGVGQVGEGPLDHLPARQHLQAAGHLRALDDLHD